MSQQLVSTDSTSVTLQGLTSIFGKINSNFAEISAALPSLSVQTINFVSGGDSLGQAFTKVNQNFAAANVLTSGSYQVINVTAPDVDTVAEALIKIDDNFTSLYSSLGLNVTIAPPPVIHRLAPVLTLAPLTATVTTLDVNYAEGQELIDLGDGPDTYTGDSLYVAFSKVNHNFTELYSVFDGNGITNLNANVITATSISTSGNIRAGNIFTYGNIETIGYIVASGAFYPNGEPIIGGTTSNYGNSNVASYLPTYSGNLNSVDYLTANSGNIVSDLTVGGNLFVGGNITYQNVETGNLEVANAIIVNGNITAQYFVGNGRYLSGIDTTTIQNGTSNVRVYANSNVNITTVGSNTWVFDSAGDLTAPGNITTTANVTASYFVGNFVGNISGNISAAGANTQVLFNDNNTVAGASGFTFDKTTNLVSIDGTISATQVNVAGYTVIDSTGNVVTSRLVDSGVGAGTYGNASSVPSITVDSKGRVTAVSNVAVAGVSNVAYNDTSGNLTISTSSGTNYVVDLGVGTADSPSFSGLVINGNASATYFIGNGYALTSITGANITGTVANATYALQAGQADYANTATYVTGLTGTNVNVALGYVPLDSNATALTAQYVTQAAQANITSVGILTGLTLSGTLSGTTVQAATIGNTDAVIIGNGASLTSITGSNVTGTVANATYALQSEQANNANTATTSTYVTGLTGTNVNVALGYVPLDSNATALTAQYVTQPAQANITSVGTLTGLTLSGTLNGTTLQAATIGNSGAAINGSTLAISGNAVIGNLDVLGNVTYINSTVTRVLDPIIELNTGANGAPLTGSAPYDSGIKTHYWDGSTDRQSFFGRTNDTGNFEFYSNVTSETGNVVTGTYGTIKTGNIVLTGTGSVASTFTVGANAIINGLAVNNSVTIGSTLGVTGNVSATYFIGDGSTLTGITGANVTGTVANATYALQAGQANNANTATTATYVTGLTGTNVNVALGYVPLNSNATALTAQYVTQSNQANITSVGVLTSLTTSGNATVNALTVNNSTTIGSTLGVTGNVTAPYFIGNIVGNIIGNISGNVTYASTAGTVIANAQPNITSLGTLISVTVTGNANVGNLISTGTVNGATLNIVGNATVGTLNATSINLTNNNPYGLLFVSNTDAVTSNPLITIQDPANNSDGGAALQIGASEYDTGAFANIHQSLLYFVDDSQPEYPGPSASIRWAWGGSIITSSGLQLSPWNNYNGGSPTNFVNGTGLGIWRRPDQAASGGTKLTLNTGDTGPSVHGVYIGQGAIDFFPDYGTGDDSGLAYIILPASFTTTSTDRYIGQISVNAYENPGTPQWSLGWKNSSPLSPTEDDERTPGFRNIIWDSNNRVGINTANLNSSFNVLGNAEIQSGNLIVSGSASASTFIGTIATAAQPNITSVGTLANLTVSGNVTASYFIGNIVGNISGNITAAGSNTQILFNDSGTVNGNVNLTFNKTTGTLSTAIVNAATIGNAGAVIIGNGSTLTSLTGANVTGTVANATYSLQAGQSNYANTATYVTGLTGTNVNVALGYVPLNSNATALTAQYVTQGAQANITSVGVLTSLNTSGNATVNALTVNNSVTIGSTLGVTGNVTASYFIGNIVGNISGNIAAPGANTQVLFNDNNTVNGDAGLTFNKTTDTLSTAIVNAATIGNTGAAHIGSTLTISGNAIVGNLDVLGNVTYINSTVTDILDPIIELNTAANGAPLSGNAPYDSGIKTHYWDGSADRQSFFGRTNDTGNFEFYSNVISETGNVVTGTYGTIKTGNIVLTGTGSISSTLTVGGNATVNGLAVNTSATVIGSLSAAGGLQNTPIGNVTPSTALFTTVGASGNVTISALTVNASATIGTTLGVTGNVTAGNITTAGLIKTTATTAATSNVTGAVQVSGGVGVAGNVYVGQRVGWVAANSVSAVYQIYNAATNSLDTIFG